MKMVKHIVFRIIAGLILLAAIAGIAFFAYQAGTTHAVAVTVQQPASQSVAVPMPFYGWFPFPFFGLGCLIPLAVLFLLFVAFGSMRRMIWGSRWGWRHHGWMGHHGPEGYGPGGEGVPPMFAEWHRRAHGAPEGEKAPEENKK
jgi:hypothetical protein